MSKRKPIVMLSMLELLLEPDEGQGVAFAGLAEWRLA
jgi:hypothetical protein